MGKKSRSKRMRRQLRPSVGSPHPDAGRRAELKPRSSAKTKVMKLLEAMVDAASEDLASGADKPRVSFGQALRAGELLVRYEESEKRAAEEEADADEVDEDTYEDVDESPEAPPIETQTEAGEFTAPESETADAATS